MTDFNTTPNPSQQEDKKDSREGNISMLPTPWDDGNKEAYDEIRKSITRLECHFLTINLETLDMQKKDICC